jgi:transcriptional regulator with XRE-family HTH domain
LRTKDEILRRIGLRIRKIRESKDITQSELARLSDKDRQNIYRLEKGKINPSIYSLYEIAQALGVDLSDITGVD